MVGDKNKQREADGARDLCLALRDTETEPYSCTAIRFTTRTETVPRARCVSGWDMNVEFASIA